MTFFNLFSALSKWSLFLITILLFACTGTSNKSEDTDLKLAVDWEHLSSKNGDIPAPGPSTQQTASLILDVDKDGVNDFIVGSRKVGPALLWYRRLAEGWDKYTIEPEFLAVEAG